MRMLLCLCMLLLMVGCNKNETEGGPSSSVVIQPIQQDPSPISTVEPTPSPTPIVELTPAPNPTPKILTPEEIADQNIKKIIQLENWKIEDVVFLSHQLNDASEGLIVELRENKTLLAALSIAFAAEKIPNDMNMTNSLGRMFFNNHQASVALITSAVFNPELFSLIGERPYQMVKIVGPNDELVLGLAGAYVAGGRFEITPDGKLLAKQSQTDLLWVNDNISIITGARVFIQASGVLHPVSSELLEYKKSSSWACGREVFTEKKEDKSCGVELYKEGVSMKCPGSKRVEERYRCHMVGGEIDPHEVCSTRMVDVPAKCRHPDFGIEKFAKCPISTERGSVCKIPLAAEEVFQANKESFDNYALTHKEEVSRIYWLTLLSSLPKLPYESIEYLNFPIVSFLREASVNFVTLQFNKLLDDNGILKSENAVFLEKIKNFSEQVK